MLTTLKDAAVLSLAWFVLFSQPAHAYFDLGVGTYLLQLLTGFAFAFWLSFRKSFGSFLPKRQPAAPKVSESETESKAEPEVT